MLNPPGKAMHAGDALLARSIPNFFFHVMTAYALLRAGGVDVGKTDFLGDLPPMFDQSAGGPTTDAPPWVANAPSTSPNPTARC